MKTVDWIDPAHFRRTTITNLHDRQQVEQARQDYRLMVLCVLDAILRRSERDPDYPFIDTKLHLLTGRDYPADDPIRGQNAIFGWIQGRGLEALAGHDGWLGRQNDLDESLRQEFHQRIVRVLSRVVAQMESIRLARGHIFFMMRPDGTPVRVGSDGRVVPLAGQADVLAGQPS